jgi:hypothetical protein
VESRQAQFCAGGLRGRERHNHTESDGSAAGAGGRRGEGGWGRGAGASANECRERRKGANEGASAPVFSTQSPAMPPPTHHRPHKDRNGPPACSKSFCHSSRVAGSAPAPRGPARPLPARGLRPLGLLPQTPCRPGPCARAPAPTRRSPQLHERLPLPSSQSARPQPLASANDEVTLAVWARLKIPFLPGASKVFEIIHHMVDRVQILRLMNLLETCRTDHDGPPSRVAHRVLRRACAAINLVLSRFCLYALIAPRACWRTRMVECT